MRCFIVLGADRAPVLKTITPARFRLHVDRDCLGGGPAAVAVTFGAGFEVAIPAWDKECLTAVATKYTGPHETRVRGMAAAIVLGMDFPEPPRKPAAQEDKKPNDGLGVRPVAPQPSLPPLQS